MKPDTPETGAAEPVHYPGDPPPEEAGGQLSESARALVEGPVARAPGPAATRRGLGVATCQFAVSRQVRGNLKQILHQLERSAAAGARIVQFPEAALSGYVGRDHERWTEVDTAQLDEASARIAEQARRLGVWVLLGSLHPLSDGRPPHNCVYVIDDQGSLVDRYDKRFCTTHDLENYTPGNHPVFFEVDGVRCGVAICFDIRFPELYREYKSAGTHLVLQCNYDARGRGRTHFRHIMRQTMQTRCATNHMWMSATNSSAHYQSYPSVFVRPDGRIAARLKDHRPGFMVNTVDLDEDIYDAAGPHRVRALQGASGNGRPFFDRRSLDRQRW